MSSFRTRPIVGLPAATKISQGPSGVSVPMGMQLGLASNFDYTPLVNGFNGRLIRLGSHYPGPWDVGAAPIPAGAIATNVNAAAARGWEIMFNLNAAGTAPLGGNDPTNYKAYVSAVVTALIGKVTLFNLRNEPVGVNISGHVTNAGDMIAEAALAYEALKAANPLARLIGPTDTLFGDSGGRTVRMPAYLAGGFFDTLDGLDIHNYFWGIPEHGFAQETSLVERAVHSIKPNFPIYVSEFGWRIDPSPADDAHNYASSVAEQGRRISRALAIYRCIANIAAVSLYTIKDDGAGQYGLLDTNSAEKTCGQYYRDTLLHINTWYAAAAYVPGIAPGRPEYDLSFYYYGVETAPWIVRGTLLDESQELMVWHPSVASFPLRIVLKASSAGNLKILTVGGSTATSSLVAGVQSVDVVLGATPQIIYSDDADLIFPGYNH